MEYKKINTTPNMQVHLLRIIILCLIISLLDIADHSLVHTHSGRRIYLAAVDHT